MADTKEEIFCPACGEKMVKVFVDNANHYVDICLNGCGGILFDNRELEHFDEQHENIAAIVEAYKGKTFKKVDESEKRICPVCDGVMIKNHTSAAKNVEIDECYCCGAKFLDYGELNAIREEFATEKERSKDFNNHFNKVFGAEIEKNDKEYQEALVADTFYEKFFKESLEGFFTKN